MGRKRCARVMASASLVLVAVAWFALGCGGVGVKREPTERPAPPSGAHGPAVRGSGHVAAVILDSAGKQRAAVRADGAIEEAARDGRGGWYAWGGFHHVGGVEVNGLAHLDRDGRIDARWRPRLGPHPPDGIVASVIASRRRVYLAGNFGSVNGVARRGLGAVDAATGRLDRRWTPPGADLGASPVALGAGRVIVGIREEVQALDLRSGTPARRFRVRTGPDNTEGPGVRALAAGGRWLYVGGRFTKINGVRRIGLGRVDARTGRVDLGWRPPLLVTRPCQGCDGDVMGLALGRGRLYVLGGFSAAGKVRTPGGLVALAISTGRPTKFRPPAPGPDAVGDSGTYQSVVEVGSRVFAAGDFGDAGKTHGHGFAVLDARTGAPLAAWHPRSPRAQVLRAVSSNSLVLVAGDNLAP